MKGSIYFLGIGGISMSGLARFYHLRGFQVSGYDKTPSPLTKQLEEEGIAIHYDENPSLIPENPDLVVYTPAIPKDNKEWLYVNAKHYPLKKRSEVLGMLTSEKKCVAVAGSHGKTTTSSMIAYILSQSNTNCTAFLGGIANNFKSNFHSAPKSCYVVTEADEYDRSFLQLYPTFSVITATDPDHLDIYGSVENMRKAFEQFAAQTQKDGCLFYKEGIKLTLPQAQKSLSYHLSSSTADYAAENIVIKNGNYHFDLRTPDGIISDLVLTYPGKHNVENAVAALAVCIHCGVSQQELRDGLFSFAGVYRRFDYKIRRPDFVYIDDYAHHPAEISMLIHSVRELYPDKKITGIFQPHLYSRTRDFMTEFASVLSLLDTVVLMDIYPARELPIANITSKALSDKIQIADKHLLASQDIIPFLKDHRPEILLTIGAGNIDRLVAPIIQAFNHEE